MNKTQNYRPHKLALAVTVALGTLPASGWAAAGRIQFAFGQVNVERDGGTNAPLKRGDNVDAGDTIVTESGRAQIKFSDGSYVSLQPKTSFKIEDYKYGGDGAEERSYLSLVRGGLRAISGVIGRRDRNSYRLSTPVGTIGIRGTEYLVMLDGSGLIVTVGDGAIDLVTDAGEVRLVNGQTGRIVDKGALPVIVDRKAVVPPPQKNTTKDPAVGESEQDNENLLIAVTDDNGIPLDTLGNLLDDDLPQEPVDGPLVGTPTKLESGPGFAVAATLDSSFFASPINQVDSGVDAVFTEGQLTSWQNGANGPADIGQLSLVEAGSDAIIGWGRWSNPTTANRTFTFAGQAHSFSQKDQSLHFVTGRPTNFAEVVGAGISSANYSVGVFTTPTEKSGALWNFDKPFATFGVNFATQQVSGSVGVSLSALEYFLSFVDLNAAGGTFSGGADVSSGSSCFSAPCSGAVAGLVAGPRGERAGFTYHIGDPDLNKDIFGAVTFVKDPNGPAPPTGGL